MECHQWCRLEPTESSERLADEGRYSGRVGEVMCDCHADDLLSTHEAATVEVVAILFSKIVASGAGQETAGFRDLERTTRADEVGFDLRRSGDREVLYALGTWHQWHPGRAGMLQCGKSWQACCSSLQTVCTVLRWPPPTLPRLHKLLCKHFMPQRTTVCTADSCGGRTRVA